MNSQKGFTTLTAVLIALGILVLGVGGYVAINPEVLQKSGSDTSVESTTTVQTAPGDHPEEDHDANEGVTANQKTSIEWRFTNAGEVNGTQRTKVTTIVNGKAYEMGTFDGSCKEIDANGGIDGKGLLTGELSAAQCWFAGSGNEIGVFGHEDGGVEMMTGTLSEGDEGAGMFRGNFTIKHTVRF